RPATTTSTGVGEATRATAARTAHPETSACGWSVRPAAKVAASRQASGKGRATDRARLALRSASCHLAQLGWGPLEQDLVCRVGGTRITTRGDFGSSRFPVQINARGRTELSSAWETAPDRQCSEREPCGANALSAAN